MGHNEVNVFSLFFSFVISDLVKRLLTYVLLILNLSEMPASLRRGVGEGREL